MEKEVKEMENVKQNEAVAVNKEETKMSDAVAEATSQADEVGVEPTTGQSAEQVQNPTEEIISESASETVETMQDKEMEQQLDEMIAKGENATVNALNGIEISKDNKCAVIAIDQTKKYRLELRCVKSSKSQRRYELVEVNIADNRDVILEGHKRIEPNKLESGAGNLIRDFLTDCEGIYDRQETTIKKICSEIIRKKVLNPRIEDADVLSKEEFLEEFKQWLIDHPDDARVLNEMIGTKHIVGIMQGGEHSKSYDSLKSILEEIAPDNDPKDLKDYLVQKKVMGRWQPSQTAQGKYNIACKGRIYRIFPEDIIKKIPIAGGKEKKE